MKNVLILSILFFQFTGIAYSQDSLQSRFTKEIGVITSDFKSYDMSFKIGGKSNWFFRAKSANLVFGKDSIRIPDTTINVLTRSGGMYAGIEKRIYVGSNLSWAFGLDFFAHYGITKDNLGENHKEEIISSYKNKEFTRGIALPLSFNYQFANNRVMFSFEIAPQLNKTTLTNEYFTGTGNPLENETEKNTSTKWSFIDSGTIHFSLVYRFFRE